MNELKMEFDYKDLFINENGIYYFQIIFSKNLDQIFGKPIFKKYRIVFDQDKKMYSIYKYYQKENKNENKIINNPNDNDSNNNRFINELKDENDYDNYLNNDKEKNIINN